MDDSSIRRLGWLWTLALALPSPVRADTCAPAERIFADGYEVPSPPVSPLQLAFTAQPAGGDVGATLVPFVAVTVADACGATVTARTVTLALGQDPSGRATLGGTLAVASGAGGSAVFTDLAVDWAGSGFTLVASAMDGPDVRTTESAPFDQARVGDACLGPDQPCDCADFDGDGLNDAWENAGGVDANGDGVITDAQHDVLLADADPGAPDIYVRYDWMDHGPDDQSCATTNECLGLGRAHLGEACGPAGSPLEGQCYYACALDSDCTSRWPADVHAGERCIEGICQHTHDPFASGADVFAPMAAAFAAHGIALHLVRGEVLPHSHVVSFRADAQMTVSCEGADLGSQRVGVGKYAVSYVDVKPALPAEVAYHRALFAHNFGCDSVAHCLACPDPLSYGSAGIAERSGDDLVVSLGTSVNDSGIPPRYQLPGTLMHELGHNLGIRHDGHTDTQCHDDGDCVAGDTCADLFDGQGKSCHESFNLLLGAEEPNYKPNYLSIMNYAYELSLVPFSAGIGSRVPKACATGADCGGGNAVCVLRNQQGRCSASARVCDSAVDCPGAAETCVAPPTPLGNCATNGYACESGDDCQPGDTCVPPSGPGTCARIDYSRQVLPTGGTTPGALDEADLDDAAGLGSGNADLFNYTDALCHTCPLPAPTQGPVNWAGAGVITTPSCRVIQIGPESYTDAHVRADVDALGDCDPLAADLLHGHADWPDVSGIPFHYRFLCPIVDPPMPKRRPTQLRTWVR